ncbi:hypothetical protein KI387_027220 [Taxus chinensis]|uniref:acetylglutamate kinase n=1 Tax=Taxus chinensis TaxID=29808 RepID=A0AA38L8U7_TAXCH|nr:hypothetical protein KI387_027220 [Taxus chinensis]
MPFMAEAGFPFQEDSLPSEAVSSHHKYKHCMKVFPSNGGYYAGSPKFGSPRDVNRMDVINHWPEDNFKHLVPLAYIVYHQAIVGYYPLEFFQNLDVASPRRKLVMKPVKYSRPFEPLEQHEAQHLLPEVYEGKTVVIKYGGAAIKSDVLKNGVIKDLVLLSCVGLRPVFVHGGGPEINEWLARVGIRPQFKNGPRFTEAPTMGVVEMVLVGKVNKSLISLINGAGGNVVGLCGKDGKLITARPTGEDLGFAGEFAHINTSVLKAIVDNGSIPMISSVATDDSGKAYNINVDTVIGKIVASLGVEFLILLTDLVEYIIVFPGML